VQTAFTWLGFHKGRASHPVEL